MSLIVIPNWRDHFQPDQDEEQVQAIINQLSEVTDPFLLLTNYLPKWRSYSRQLGLDQLRSWSAFDALQRVQLTVKKPLQLEDLTWPEGAQFIRMFDRIVVLVNFSHYASVFFTYPKANQIDRIDLFSKGQMIQQLTVDDRGFVSRVLDYEDSVLTKVSYLSQSGSVVAEENCQTGQIHALLPDGRVADYPEMADLLAELVSAYLHSKKVTQLFMVDSAINRALLAKAHVEHPLIWLGQPRAKQFDEARLALPDNADLFVGQEETDREYGNATLLAPYPVKKEGQAQRKGQSLLYFQLAGMTDQEQEELLNDISSFILEEDNRTAVLEGGNQVALKKQVQDFLETINQDGQKKIDELLAHFIFLPVQRPEKRQAHLLTASLYVDLAFQPDLSIIATAAGLGLRIVTAVETAYTLKKSKDVVTIDSVEDRLLDAVNDDSSSEQNEMEILQNKQSLPEQMKKWQKRLGLLTKKVQEE